MRKLFDFLIAKRHWFLFILLEAIAFLFLLNANMYNKSMYLYVNNKIIGSVNEVVTEYKDYISLKEKNEELRNKVAYLEGQYLRSLQAFEDYKSEVTSPNDSIQIDSTQDIKYITARVINVNKYQDNVYYVINKGENDGIRENLGVVSNNGVVGSIMKTSKHYSIIIPIINPMMQLSCSILNKGFTSSLSIDKRYTNSALLTKVPSHIEILPKDTVITSGFSDIFPRGLIVGTISKSIDKNDDPNSSKTYSVKLSTNFDNLSHVYIIIKNKDTEIDSLISQIKKK